MPLSEAERDKLLVEWNSYADRLSSGALHSSLVYRAFQYADFDAILRLWGDLCYR